MSDATPQRDESGLKTAVLIAYGLFLLAYFNGITAIAGAVLIYIKRGEALGTVWESHCRNLIRVFWVSAIFLGAIVFIVLEGFGGMFFAVMGSHDAAPALAGLLFLLIPVLALVCVIFTIWYLYRTVRGIIRALESKAY